MPKGSGGGSNIFSLNQTGDGLVGTLAWINLGLIPTGKRIWFGSLLATSPDKSITFEVRTNLLGKSTGNDSDTLLLASTSATPKSGTKFLDMYKNGRLHIISVNGTGVEHFWIKLKSKGANGSYLYSINYTTE